MSAKGFPVKILSRLLVAVLMILWTVFGGFPNLGVPSTMLKSPSIAIQTHPEMNHDEWDFLTFKEIDGETGERVVEQFMPQENGIGSSVDADIQSVEAVIRLYFEGTYNADQEMLERAFHPKAHIVGNIAGTYSDETTPEFINRILSQPSQSSKVRSSKRKF